MLITSGLLGLLYVVFAVVLFSVLNVGLIAMVVIIGGIALFQYFTSNKLALAASGAKVVEPDEAPELHAMVICPSRGSRSSTARSRTRSRPAGARSAPQSL